MTSTTAKQSMAAQNEPGRGRWLVFGVLAFAQYLMTLDTSIVFVALPSIQTDLHFTQTGLAWVMNAFILSFGGFLMLGGRAADVFGRRRVLTVGLVLMGIASLACGLSTQPWQIVTARAIQGLAGALVLPTTMALVLDIFEPGPDRNKALAILASLGGIAGATGTVFGGLLTAIAWQAAFLVYVPIMLLLLVFGVRVVPASAPTATGGMDVWGSLTGTGGLCLLLYGLLEGGNKSWTSAAVLGALAAAVVLLAAFVLRQLRAAVPLIPRQLFGLRNVVFGNLTNVVLGTLLVGIFFVLTLHLQAERGYSPVEAALLTTPICLGLFAGANIVVRLFARMAPVTVLVLAFSLQAVALVWWVAVLDVHANIVLSFILPGMLYTFGMGLAIVPAVIICTTGVEGDVAGAASGLNNTTLQIGGAIGVALLSTLSQHRFDTALADGDSMAEASNAGHAWALAGGAGVAVVGLLLALMLRAGIRGQQPPADSQPAEPVAAEGIQPA
ncbi:MFS transporter [Streptomyces sp. NBC_00347]|uniref:MFS transporter n=1 Tax=Streptomyces sp. NBC_00347 TaxID=2975721 RepID=UPI002255F4DC|nr:MFS transporter [Streptomyces sp. NBC_00347]MCX5123636.1 MFS transporter [Streptomyces sp. NBC_00347]